MFVGVGVGVARHKRVSEPYGGGGRHVVRLRQVGHEDVVRFVPVETDGEDVM